MTKTGWDMDIIKQLAVEQRKRLIAGLLGAAEQSPWWSKLSRDEQRAYRDKVLQSAGVYHDFMLDIIKVGGDAGSTINGHALELIEQLHAGQRRLEVAVSKRD